MQTDVGGGMGTFNAERAEEMARDLLDWSKRSGERLVEVVRREVRRQLKLVGVATRDELSALKKRVTTLEREVRGRGGAKATSSKKKAAGSTTSKSSSKRTSTRKRSASSG